MGVFSPKSRAKTMIESESQNVDGCAIFWKTEKFLVSYVFQPISKNSGILAAGKPHVRVQPAGDQKLGRRSRYSQ
jgi:mRNA deadenylase 3'-5' endonuclease subunit Ccr4